MIGDGLLRKCKMFSNVVGNQFSPFLSSCSHGYLNWSAIHKRIIANLNSTRFIQNKNHHSEIVSELDSENDCVKGK